MGFVRGPVLGKDADKELKERQRKRAASEWPGFSSCIEEELVSAGGELKWKKLRARVTERYRKEHPEDARPEEEIHAEVMAEIPTEYCEDGSPWIKLPPKKMKKIQRDKRQRRVRESCVGICARGQDHISSRTKSSYCWDSRRIHPAHIVAYIKLRFSRGIAIQWLLFSWHLFFILFMVSD